jgi:hypothetical protein
MATTKSPDVCKSLLHGFDCKFLGRDFDHLSQKINVFNLLFRGGELDGCPIETTNSLYLPPDHEKLKDSVNQTI